MSRLIFEGNTTERFGEFFPNPFIEQIRLFDNQIQVDVGLYFEMPTDDTEANDYIAYMAENLNIFGAFFERTQFDRITEQKFVSSNVIRQFYKNSFFTLNFDANDYRKEIDLTQVELFFNSEGKRFAKALINFIYPDSSSLRDFYENQDDRYFATFTSFVRPTFSIGETIDDYFSGHNALYIMPSEQEERLKNQTSDLVYEKIFRRPTLDDSTAGLRNIVNTEPKEVYLQPDGHYYQKTPLQSLDKRYRKTDLVDHVQVVNAINPIIAPFIGSFEEGNMISMTLQEFSDSPRLLTELQKNINKFSNKSRVTTIGKLYESLVDAVADIDNILIGSGRLQKRLIPNTRIVDNRGLFFEDEVVSFDIEGTTRSISTENTRGHQTTYLAEHYLSMPFTSRNVIPSTWDYKSATGTYEGSQHYVKNESYIFFDYEKSLNYNSYISKVFNPHAILQVFGKNSLNAYYQNNKIKVEKYKSLPFQRIRTVTENEFYYIEKIIPDPDAPEDPTIRSPGWSRSQYVSYNEDNHYFGKPITYDPFGTNTKPEFDTIYSKLVEKTFDTFDSLNGYRLRCFQFTDLESFEIAEDFTKYRVIVTIDDQTMQFYDDLMSLLKYILGLLNRFLDAADDFCSFNTLDGRFNDFFVEAMKNEFGAAGSAGTRSAPASRATRRAERGASGPSAAATRADAPGSVTVPGVPWVLGPQYYYYIMALIDNSWTTESSPVTGDGVLRFYDAFGSGARRRASIPAPTTTRNLDGSFVNVETARRLSVTKSNQISPQNGTLAELQAFVDEFRNLVEILDVGGDMDERVEIYDVLSSGVATLKEAGEITVERTFIVNEGLIDSYEVSDVERPDAPGGGGGGGGSGGLPGAGGGGLDFPSEIPGAFLEDIVRETDEEGAGGKTVEEIAETLPNPSGRPL